MRRKPLKRYNLPMQNELQIAIASLQKQVKLIIEFLDLLDKGSPTLANNMWVHENKVREKMTAIVKQLRELATHIASR